MDSTRATDTSSPIPWWMWLNIISIDAVAVGCCWVAVFTAEFCDRLPRFYEAAIVGLSIWLVYTADRLFDAIRVDPSEPHTLRHRFHARHRRLLWLSWIIALAINVALIVSFASEPQLRIGVVGIAAVVVYIVSVQWVRPIVRVVPKEVLAGTVFSFGVSLVAWSQCNPTDIVRLLLANAMAASVFSANCFSIAIWESNFDRAQGFDSLASRIGNPKSVFAIWLLTHFAVASVLLLLGLTSWFLFSCIAASAGLLAGLMCVAEGNDHRSRGVLADFVLVGAPLVCFLCFGCA